MKRITNLAALGALVVSAGVVAACSDGGTGALGGVGGNNYGGGSPSATATATSPAPTSATKDAGSNAPPPPTSGAGTAKAFYLSSVDATIRPTCASCHATGASSAPIFMAGTPDASYTSITSGTVPGILAPSANSMLLLHGAHTGPALTDAQASTVKSWLDMEAKERNLTVPANTMTVQSALQQFASCMQLSDFTDRTANGVSAADVARSNTTNNGTCNGCHSKGDGGFWASYGTFAGADQTQVMFDNTKTFPYIKKWVTGTVDANGQFKELVSSDSISTKMSLADSCTGKECHPKFQLLQQQVDSITAFVNATLTRMKNNQCTAAPAPAADAGP